MDIRPKKELHATIQVPGDKSISHRSIMFGALAEGVTTVQNFLLSQDCLSTIACFKALGVDIRQEQDKIIVHGKGLHGLQPAEKTLDVGNSGTTIRLISGILAGQPFNTTLTGDASIQKRPMGRVIKPLTQMGAKIAGQTDPYLAPLTIKGSPLKGIEYTLPVASAQVKSAILLAGLYADGPTTVIEPEATRDHTEIMLSHMGAKIEKKQTAITIEPNPALQAMDISVPGDISSAAYFMVAAAITPNAAVTIENVGINPTRTGILTVLEQMGAKVNLSNIQIQGGEKTASITVTPGPLKGITIEKELIPTLIDELPVISVLACFAEGITVIKDAQELKVKESNRIQAMVTELSKMGANIQETEDGMIIRGKQPLHHATLKCYQDHRIAMSLAVAGTAAQGCKLLEPECVNISFPEFFSLLESL